MQRLAALQNHVQDLLGTQFTSTLPRSTSTKPAQVACGVAELDELFQGGLPIGVITELVGESCSGRTTSAMAYLAALVQAGSVCAWIDAQDCLDPESAAASGIDLERLLWVRCGTEPAGKLQQTPESEHGTASSQTSSAAQSKPVSGGSPHPRSESRGMDQAVGMLLQAPGHSQAQQVHRKRRDIGTPGAPNRPLTAKSPDREEQVNSDRLPPRRGDNLALVSRFAGSAPKRPPGHPSREPLTQGSQRPQRSSTPDRDLWPVLDQALRVADLLLQNGGFSAIVLDLGNVPPEFAWRIPLATWFRFRAACERTRASMLLLTQHPCARSSAELVVRMQTGQLDTAGNVITGIRYRPVVQRSRSAERETRVVPIRKPPQPAHAGQWKSRVAWGHAG